MKRVAYELQKGFAATSRLERIIKSNDFLGKIAKLIIDLSGGKTSDG